MLLACGEGCEVEAGGGDGRRRRGSEDPNEGPEVSFASRNSLRGRDVVLQKLETELPTHLAATSWLLFPGEPRYRKGRDL